MVSSPVEREEQVRAHLQSLQLRAWSHAVTLRLAIITGDRETSWKTASGILCEFGKRAVVGTAWHVLGELQRLKREGTEVVLICDNMPIPEPRTVYCDELADIAFVEIPLAGRRGMHAVPYRPRPHWPPSRVKSGDSVLLCGFPAMLRDDGEEILHGDLNLLLDVASVSDSHFKLQVHWDQMIDAGRVTLPKEQVDFGGASGGPVFLSDNGCNELVGLISEAAPTLPLWCIASLASVPDLEGLDGQPV